MKLGLYPPISHAIHLQLKAQTGAVHNHLQGKVQVVKLDAAGGGEAGEEAPRHGVEVRGEGADVDEIARVGLGWLVGVAGDEVVCDDEVLAWSEVAGVVEGDG